VESALAKYLRTLSTDKPRQLLKLPAAMALIHVSLTGLKHATCR
jgi:hypothetical protein